LGRLLDRGARQLKFVDRTFNLHPATSRAVLEFLLERYQPGQFFHFEVIPDHLPEPFRDVIARFPAGALQFEAGVQTFDPEVATRIERRQDYAQMEQNLRWLRQETGVHVHADLIVGLPGESLESVAAGFDRLIELRPQEIQVGLLKRLRGAPIARHNQPWRMEYNPHPPYEILRNGQINFPTMQRLRRFARYWDLIGNSGNFVETTPLIWSQTSLASTLSTAELTAGASGQPGGRPSPFAAFLRFSDWLFAQARRTDSIALLRLMKLLFLYLTQELRLEARAVAQVMERDYQRGGRREQPGFLAEAAPAPLPRPSNRPDGIPRRQARHQSRNSASDQAPGITGTEA
jgi:hypothetical protein